MTAVQSFIALNRFGLGPAPGEISRITDGPGWVMEQLRQPLESYSDGNPPVGQIVQSLKDLQMMKKEAKQDGGVKPEGFKDQRDDILQWVLNAIQARFIRNVTAANGLQERLVLFWSNHFTVSSRNKAAMAAIMPTLERDAIRPHILGKFEDMLLAVEQHPAMLLYLDNASSAGPNSIAGQRRGVGLNENLGREILELHTLGVNGGYTQTDVTTLAKIITGWGINPPARGGDGNFHFEARTHEPGPQTLLGRVYTQDGVEQGGSALRDIAHSQPAARFIAEKLVRHFVADNPDPNDVNKVAARFYATGGNLAAVMETVVTLPSAWAQTMPKVKSPYEYMVSTFRALRLPPDTIEVKKLIGSLDTMDHRPFNAPSPAGWPDRADDWISSSAVMNRIEWGHALAQKIANSFDPLATARDILGPAASSETLTAISRAPSAVDGLALFLASPEFQRR